jgi:hypothetical protein
MGSDTYWTSDRRAYRGNDRLKRLFEVDAAAARMAAGRKPKRRVRTQKGIARFGDAAEFDVVVWDECHRLRRRDTARSRLARKVSDESGFEFWLSATAGQDPLELEYLAPLLAAADGQPRGALKDYPGWCRSQGIGILKGAFGKTYWRGASKEEAERDGSDEDLAIIRRLLFGGETPAGIRRTPSDIRGWPEINRIMMPCTLEPSDRALYHEAWTEFRRQLELGGAGARDSKNALVARLRFRQKSSLLRTSATVDLALSLLEQGLQVAISVGFLETLAVIREALVAEGYGVAEITGQLDSREKEAQRLDFQHGRKRVVVYTVEEAISLHQGEHGDAPRVNLLHDIRWSAIQMRQIEGRTHRDGKFSQVYWMLGADTVEEGIAEVVAGRTRSMGAMQGDEATMRAVEEMLSSR